MDDLILHARPMMPPDASPREMFRETLGDLPIRGGWGYGPEDAIIIDHDDTKEGVASEYEIIMERTKLEIKQVADESEFEIVGFHGLRQALSLVDGMYYDVIYCKVNVKWNDSGAVSTYEEECWFNITRFFGNRPEPLDPNVLASDAEII